jgi:hypothetical protein
MYFHQAECLAVRPTAVMHDKGIRLAEQEENVTNFLFIQ